MLSPSSRASTAATLCAARLKRTKQGSRWLGWIEPVSHAHRGLIRAVLPPLGCDIPSLAPSMPGLDTRGSS